MRGITFGEKHSYHDWNLMLTSKEIGFPEPKKETISIIGADGILDFSQSLTGDMKYNNRKLSFEFFVDTSYRKWYPLVSRIANYLHGQTLKIILDDDFNFFYIGAAEINKFKTNRNIGSITIDCDVEPYKYDLLASNEDWIWDTFSFEDGIINETKNLIVKDKLEVSIYGRRKHVIPKFTCSNPMQVVFCGQTFQLPKGSYEAFDIEIVEGENKFKFIGKGTVSIFYRGGSL